jgi:hypothetical protein
MFKWNADPKKWRRWLAATAIATVAVVSLAVSVGPVAAMAASQPAPVVASGQPSADITIADALQQALYDEYLARDTYQAIIAKFGAVRPFANIVRAEEVHIAALKPLFESYGIPAPEDPYAGTIGAPATLQEACVIGYEAEVANVAMYDRLLTSVQDPAVTAVFTDLRNASERAHMPAFQRCAERGAFDRPWR